MENAHALPIGRPVLAQFMVLLGTGQRYRMERCTCPRIRILMLNRIESSHRMLKKKWYKTYRRMHMYYFSGVGTRAGEIP